MISATNNNLIYSLATIACMGYAGMRVVEKFNTSENYTATLSGSSPDQLKLTQKHSLDPIINRTMAGAIGIATGIGYGVLLADIGGNSTLESISKVAFGALAALAAHYYCLPTYCRPTT